MFLKKLEKLIHFLENYFICCMKYCTYELSKNVECLSVWDGLYVRKYVTKSMCVKKSLYLSFVIRNLCLYESTTENISKYQIFNLY